MAHLGFDATQVPPDSGQLDPIPAGWYNVMVDESEIKPTSDGLGARLAVRFNVVDGEFANRKIYTGFNIRNANPVAQEIAFKQLSALAHAVGVLNIQDSQQLHGIPLKVRVKIKPPKDGYDAQNEITSYKDVNYVPDSKGGAASGPAAPAAPAGFGAPPAAPAGFGAPAPAPAAVAPAPAPAACAAVGAPAQPWAQPAAPAPATVAPPPAFTPPAPPAPAAEAFPPAGWTAHPTAPGYFYQGQEVLSEADLRARMAPAAAPAAPPAAPAESATPDPAAVAGVAVPPWNMAKG